MFFLGGNKNIYRINGYCTTFINKECPDQPAQMRPLIWTFAVCIWHKDFSHVAYYIALLSPEPQHEKSYLLTCQQRLKTACTYAQSDLISCPHEEKLHPELLKKNGPSEDVEQTVCWMHMSEDTSSDFATDSILLQSNFNN